MEKHDMDKNNMNKLDLDQLDNVSGGVITDSQKSMLNSVLLQAKSTGSGLNDVLGMIPGYYNMLHSLYPDVTLEEVQAYVADVWDTI